MKNEEPFTQQECDLIYAIRNFRRSFPNGQKNLERYAFELYQELMFPGDNE